MNSAPGPPGDDSALFVIGLIGADASQGGAALQFANQLAGTRAFRQRDASASPSALFHHDVERGVLYVAMMTKPAPLASRLADTVGSLAAETPPPASASPGVIQSWIAGHAHNHVRALLLLASACHMVLIVSDRCSTDLPLLQTLRSVWELRVQTRSSVNAIIAGARGGTPPAAAALGFVFGPVPDALAADIASAAAATPVGGQAASAATAAGGGADDSRAGASSQADAARSGARAPGTNGCAVRVVGQVGPGLRGGRGGRGGRGAAGGGAPVGPEAGNRTGGGVCASSCGAGGTCPSATPGVSTYGSALPTPTAVEATPPVAAATWRQEEALEAARRQLELALDDQLRRLIGGSKLLTRALAGGANSLFALAPAGLTRSQSRAASERSGSQAAGGDESSASVAHLRAQEEPAPAAGGVRPGGVGAGGSRDDDEAESFLVELLGMMVYPAAARGVEAADPFDGAGGLASLFRDLYAPPPPLLAQPALFSGQGGPCLFSGQSGPGGSINGDGSRGLPGSAPRVPTPSLPPHPRRASEQSACAAAGRDAALRFCHGLAVGAGVGPATQLDVAPMRGGGRGGRELAVGMRLAGTVAGKGAAVGGGWAGGGRSTGKGARANTPNKAGGEDVDAAHRTAAEWAVMFETLSAHLLGRRGADTPPAADSAATGPPTAPASSPAGAADAVTTPSPPEPRLSSPSLTRLMDADTLFFSTACAVALARARQSYALRLPPRYSEAEHMRRVRAAEAELRAGGCGPDYAHCLGTLRRECDGAWRDGRQECGALSLTGRPCVLAAHTLPPTEEKAAGTEAPPQPLQGGGGLPTEGSGTPAAGGGKAAGSPEAPGEVLCAPAAAAPQAQGASSIACSQSLTDAGAGISRSGTASRSNPRGQVTLAHSSEAEHRLACNCGKSTRLLADPFSFGQAEGLFSADCCDSLPHAWLWLQATAGLSIDHGPRPLYGAAPPATAPPQIAPHGTIMPEAAPPERATAERAPTEIAPSGPLPPASPAPAPVPFTTGVVAAAGSETILRHRDSSIASTDVACRARLTLLPSASDSFLICPPGMLPTHCALTPVLLATRREAPAVTAAAPESHGGAVAEAFPMLGTGSGCTPGIRGRGGRQGSHRKATKAGSTLYSSPAVSAGPTSLSDDGLARVGCEYECCDGHRAILQPSEHAPAPAPRQQRRRRQPNPSPQQLPPSQSPQSRPPQPNEPPPPAAPDRSSPIPLSWLLEEPTPLTRPCAHTACSRLAQLQRIHLETPSQGATVQLQLRVRFFENPRPEAGGSCGGQSGGDCGGGADGERSDGAGGSLGGATLAQFAPVMLPRGARLVVRLPFVYQAQGGRPLATAATAAEECHAATAMLLPGWLAVVGA